MKGNSDAHRHRTPPPPIFARAAAADKNWATVQKCYFEKFEIFSIGKIG
jgi:hypothetical protein